MFSRLNVRTKLLVMLLPAALGLCGLAGLGVKTRLDDRTAAQLTSDASTIAVTASNLVHELQTERVAAATAAATPTSDLEAALVEQRRATDQAVTRLRTAIDQQGGSLAAGGPASDVAALGRSLEQVTPTRRSGTTPAGIAESYTDLIHRQLAAIGRLELVAGDDVSGNTTSRRWLAAGIEAESGAAAAAAGLLAPTASEASRAEAAATAQELVERSGIFYDTYNEYARSEGVEEFKRARNSAGSAATDDLFEQLASADGAQTFATEADAATWPGLVRSRLAAVQDVEVASYGDDIARVTASAEAADSAVVYFAAAAAGTCLLVLLLAFTISRNITAALRRLTDAAREISGEQVPALVQSLKSGTGVLGVRFTEVETGSSDELAEVGNALNDLGQAMVTVATEQQQSLRKGISDIFVNLARRNQTLLDRQIQFIDRLESNEQDPDQLENLFRLDHLATRMRRNAESLLVLAGAEAPRRRARDVELSDVIRVAVGEVEDFARISLMAVEDAEAIGGAAVDIAHLLAELMENGAQYSPPEKTVDIVGHRSADGGYVISITDHGVGMTPDRLSDANRLLAKPPPVGLALSRALGFVVAGTLANRHGIHIHLGASASGGVTAEVTLPPTLIRSAEVEIAPVPAALAPVTAAPSTGFDPSAFDPAAPFGADAPFEPSAPFEPTAAGATPVPTTAVSSGWTADGEYVDVAASSTPPPYEQPYTPWEPAEAISWSEERLPTAPAPSKLIDMLPEGSAFEQGLYSLLGEDAPPPPDPVVPMVEPASFEPASFEPAPRDGTPSEAAPDDASRFESPVEPSFDSPVEPSFGPTDHGPAPFEPVPFDQVPFDQAGPTPPPFDPAPFEAAPFDPPVPTAPLAPQLWAAPIVHPRPTAATVNEISQRSTPQPPSPSPSPTTSRSAALPQRSPGATSLGRSAAATERSAAPQRAPEEVRSVLSRYRRGLDTGRNGGEPHTDDHPGANER